MAKKFHHDQVVIVEDDLEVSPDFFEYFEAALGVLKRSGHSNSILSLCTTLQSHMNAKLSLIKKAARIILEKLFKVQNLIFRN